MKNFIIPAIDIIDGKCVRLTKGDYNAKTIYSENPINVAKSFADAGYKRLHLVDLDGAKKGAVVNWKVVENIASKTDLQIDFSGGISSAALASKAFELGATYIGIGSMAVKNATLVAEWIKKFGAEKFIIGADVLNNKIAIKGWTEETTTTVFELVAQYETLGISQFFCTDISKDGLLQGPSTSLYQSILQQFPSIQLIASGGVSCINDVKKLQEIGCTAAIVGKAFYENKISIN